MIVNELMKAVTKLITHRLASTVIDYAIMIAANEATRRKALQFLISPKFIVLTQYEDDKNEMPRTIDAILKSCDSTERHSLLKNMEKFLINGIEKDLVSTGMFQTLLFHVCRAFFF